MILLRAAFHTLGFAPAFAGCADLHGGDSVPPSHATMPIAADPTRVARPEGDPEPGGGDGAASVPEPATMLVFGSALVGIALYRRRRQRGIATGGLPN
jgi:hypothetical protein